MNTSIHIHIFIMDICIRIQSFTLMHIITISQRQSTAISILRKSLSASILRITRSGLIEEKGSHEGSEFERSIGFPIYAGRETDLMG